MRKYKHDAPDQILLTFSMVAFHYGDKWEYLQIGVRDFNYKNNNVLIIGRYINIFS